MCVCVCVGGGGGGGAHVTIMCFSLTRFSTILSIKGSRLSKRNSCTAVSSAVISVYRGAGTTSMDCHYGSQGGLKGLQATARDVSSGRLVLGFHILSTTQQRHLCTWSVQKVGAGGGEGGGKQKGKQNQRTFRL